MRPLPTLWMALGLACGLALALAGCPAADDDDDTTASDDDSADPGVDDIDHATLIGRIQLLDVTLDEGEWPDYATAQVWGPFAEPFPPDVFGEWTFGWTSESWEFVTTAGECALIAPVQTVCEPWCDDGEYCDAAGDCVAMPAHAPAGTLRFEGLGGPLTMEPNDLGLYVLTEALPEPLFEAGARIDVTADGDETPAFAARVTAPPPLEPALDCAMVMPDEGPLTVGWTAAPAPDGSRVRWEMAQGHHAGNGPLIRCETDDDGELTVPAALLDAYGLAIPSLQTLTLTRFDRHTVVVATGRTVAVEVGVSRVCIASFD